MFRAILPDGNLECDRFDRTDHGVELYTSDGTLKAFIPYQNLVALMNEAVEEQPNRSIL